MNLRNCPLTILLASCAFPSTVKPAMMHVSRKTLRLPTNPRRGWPHCCFLQLAAAILLVVMTACTFHGAIRDDLRSSAVPHDEKLPLRVLLSVDAPNFKVSGGAGDLDIAMNPGVTHAIQAELSSVFSAVAVPSTASKRATDGDISAHARFSYRELSRNSLNGTFLFEGGIELQFKDPHTKKPITTWQVTRQVHYSSPTSVHVASFITGACLFICAPLTYPWIVHSAGNRAVELLEATAVEMLQGLSEDIRNDDKLLAFARGDLPPSVVASGRKSAGSASALASDVDMPPTLAAAPLTNAYAVVIGIEHYRDRLPPADFAVRDAQTTAKYLATVMGYQEENVMVLLDQNASRADIEKYTETWLRNRVNKDSSVFVYYSGHGAPNPKTGEAYLVPYDGDPAFLENTGYPLKRLYGVLSELPVKHSLVVLDSCFSGAGGRSLLAKGMRPVIVSVEGPGIVDGKTAVLSASAGDQVASTYLQKGHGLLTYYFLKGLQGAADANRDGAIDLSELFAYLKPEVERVAKRDFNNPQSPQLSPSPEGPGKGIRLVGPVVAN